MPHHAWIQDSIVFNHCDRSSNSKHDVPRVPLYFFMNSKVIFGKLHQETLWRSTAINPVMIFLRAICLCTIFVIVESGTCMHLYSFSTDMQSALRTMTHSSIISSLSKLGIACGEKSTDYCQTIYTAETPY